MARNIEEIEHVAVAVRDIEEAWALYRLLGFHHVSTEDLTDQGIRSHIMATGSVRIELLEGIDHRSHLERFLETKGPGLHHLCLRVRSLEEFLDNMRAADFETTTAQPMHDRRGRRSFLHPRTTGGLLVGLVEPWDAKAGASIE